jgi:hypothetical protein
MTYQNIDLSSWDTLYNATSTMNLLLSYNDIGLNSYITEHQQRGDRTIINVGSMVQGNNVTPYLLNLSHR